MSTQSFDIMQSIKDFAKTTEDQQDRAQAEFDRLDKVRRAAEEQSASAIHNFVETLFPALQTKPPKHLPQISAIFENERKSLLEARQNALTYVSNLIKIENLDAAKFIELHEQAEKEEARANAFSRQKSNEYLWASDALSRWKGTAYNRSKSREYCLVLTNEHAIEHGLPPICPDNKDYYKPSNWIVAAWKWATEGEIYREVREQANDFKDRNINADYFEATVKAKKDCQYLQDQVKLADLEADTARKEADNSTNAYTKLDFFKPQIDLDSSFLKTIHEKIEKQIAKDPSILSSTDSEMQQISLVRKAGSTTSLAAELALLNTRSLCCECSQALFAHVVCSLDDNRERAKILLKNSGTCEKLLSYDAEKFSVETKAYTEAVEQFLSATPEQYETVITLLANKKTDIEKQKDLPEFLQKFVSIFVQHAAISDEDTPLPLIITQNLWAHFQLKQEPRPASRRGMRSQPRNNCDDNSLMTYVLLDEVMNNQHKANEFFNHTDDNDTYGGGTSGGGGSQRSWSDDQPTQQASTYETTTNDRTYETPSYETSNNNNDYGGGGGGGTGCEHHSTKRPKGTHQHFKKQSRQTIEL